MAEVKKKFSQLDPGSVPFDGTETLAAVQGGITKRGTISGIHGAGWWDKLKAAFVDFVAPEALHANDADTIGGETSAELHNAGALIGTAPLSAIPAELTGKNAATATYATSAGNAATATYATSAGNAATATNAGYATNAGTLDGLQGSAYAKVNTATSSAATDLPVGSYILAVTPDVIYANTAVTVRNNNGVYTLSGTAAQMSGTWRACGFAVNENLTYYILMRRVA